MTGRFFILLYCCLNLFSGYTQTSGQPQIRNIGSAKFYYLVSPGGDNVLCTFLWNDSLIGLTNLDQTKSSINWNYGWGKQRGKCVLQLQRPSRSGDSSRLYVQLLPTNPTGTGNTSYSGTITSWISDGTTNGGDSVVFQLTPTVTVVTKPLGTARNNASVSIYSGSILMYTVTLTQVAPFASATELTLGDFTISDGMQLTLQIPSTLQQGSIRMKATFSSSTIPATSINAFVATWDP